MPTYEYKCKLCGFDFDVFQSMVSEPIKTCPRCKGPVERIISTGAGIIFKGSGFYETDYKHNSSFSGAAREPLKSHKDSKIEDIKNSVEHSPVTEKD